MVSSLENASALPASGTPSGGYRCNACGNRTRFDVFETRRARMFHHYTLGGELSIEEEEILELQVERVVCRWCGSAEQIEELPPVGAGS